MSLQQPLLFNKRLFHFTAIQTIFKLYSFYKTLQSKL